MAELDTSLFNTSPVPEEYLSKEQLRDVYIDALKKQHARASDTTPIRSPVQVWGNWAQAFADRRYDDQLRAAAIAQQQGAAGGLFGAGGAPGASPPGGHAGDVPNPPTSP